MDAVIAIGGIALGAGLTWLASIHGARRQAADEHARWLRDRRFDTWTEFLTLCTNVPSLARPDLAPFGEAPPTSDQLHEILKARQRCDELFGKLMNAAARAETLGPAELNSRITPILQAASGVLVDDLGIDRVRESITVLAGYTRELTPELRRHLAGTD